MASAALQRGLSTGVLSDLHYSISNTDIKGHARPCSRRRPHAKRGRLMFTFQMVRAHGVALQQGLSPGVLSDLHYVQRYKQT